MDFLPEPGFEPTTLGYLGFQVQRYLRFSQWNTKVVLFVNFECSKQVIWTIVIVFGGVFFHRLTDVLDYL